MGIATPRTILLFRRDQRGAVALMFGLLLLPLLGAVALAIDFGNIMTARTKAQMAADAAALQATGVARELIKNSDGSDGAVTTAIDIAKGRAKALFNAHAQQSDITDYTVNVTMVRDGQNLTSTVSFSVTSPNIIGKLFGHGSFTAAGSVTSAASLPSYTDVYLALDISQSMGIASNQAGMNVLYNATTNILNNSGTVAYYNRPINCVFGCHSAEMVYKSGYPTNTYKWSESFSSVAKRYGVELRIDVLRKATKSMIVTAQTDADAAPIYQFALYAMGMNATYSGPQLIELAALTNDFTQLSARADKIDLGPAPDGDSDGYIIENLATFKDKVPASGDGSKRSSSKKYAFIVTDGVRDIQAPTIACLVIGNRCMSTIATDLTGRNVSCEALKQKGVTVGVLYTTYSPINPIDTASPQQDWYKTQLVKAVGDVNKIADHLKACASPGWFFAASDDVGIREAMAKMFAQTTSAPILTQ